MSQERFNFNFGIIGAGLMAQRRAESLTFFPNTKLVCVADIEANQAKKLAEKYNCKWTSNPKELLKDDNINCIIICTVNNKLAAYAKQAVINGKNILVEKPAAIKIRDIDNLVSISEKKKVVVKVGFNHRFFPAIQKALELFKSGIIGELMFIKSTYGQKGRIGFEKEWRTNKKISGGGELIDQGVHIIDLCRLFMGEIIKVQALTKTLFWKIKVDDNDFLILQNKLGKVAFINVSSSLWRNTFVFELYGTKGIVEVSGIRSHYGPPKLKLLTKNEKKSKKVGVFQFDEQIVSFSDEDLSWRYEMKNFLNALLGKEKINGNLEDAQQALKIVFGVYDNK